MDLGASHVKGNYSEPHQDSQGGARFLLQLENDIAESFPSRAPCNLVLKQSANVCELQFGSAAMR
jgi:hypothetical protein